MTEPWSPPAEVPHTFVHERSHFPGPVRALDFALNVKAMEHGFNVALGEYQLPLRVIDLHVNDFVYEALIDADRPSVPSHGVPRPATSVLDVAVDELARLWSGQWQPAIQRHLTFWQDFELARASPIELAAHFEQTRQRSLDMWVVHFRVLLPMLIAIRRFQQLCSEIFDGWAPEDADALLIGMPSKTTEGDDVLWDLGRELHADPELAGALAVSARADARPCVSTGGISAGGWAEVRQALSRSVSGRAFLGRLETYLRDYGRRGRDWSIDRPFLVEDPSSVLAVLRTYGEASGSAREASRAEREARRVELEAVCARRSSEAPHPLRAAFRRLRRSARTAAWLSEESYYWIEGLGSYSVRQVCLEAGRRLTEAAVVTEPDDVFHLEPDEIVRALGGVDRGAISERVVARKASFDHASTLEPPAVIGGCEDEPPAGPTSEIGEALDLLFGAPVEPVADASDLNGYGASPGLVRGSVRVIASLDEADKVRAGDVLVTHTTSPGWTPLFRSIAALVTDTGGVLCHAAVVAREYGLPAVVGAGYATRVLCDGQRVEVDGGAGTVRLIDVEDARPVGGAFECL